ncbi:MAG TPA: hypothetical protein PKD54_11310 [Pirellulaceae bacterium]|nr:hypothetical protein [Pirellulaceae bacterium]
MDSFEEQLAHAKQVAEAAMGRVSAACGECCESSLQQSFLLREGILVGVRFKMGSLKAEWLIGSPHIQITRGSDVVSTESVTPTLRAA